MKLNETGTYERRDISKTLSPELVGKTCKDFRNAMNLTQAEISRLDDITIQSVNNFENGRNLSYKTFSVYVRKGLLQWLLLQQEVKK